jgi:hypothetical protein
MNSNADLCKLTMTDEAGNSVEIFVPADAHISVWIAAFKRILKFQQFNEQNIEAFLGDD